MHDSLSVAVVFTQFGPYHIARLSAAAHEFGRDKLLGIEIAAQSRSYRWDPATSRGFRSTTLFERDLYEDTTALGRVRALLSTLERERPHAVAIHGWAAAEARAALIWCKWRGAVPILMSESQQHDARRRWPVELAKGVLVRQFSAALVGGDSHRAYLETLGMAHDRIVVGYDVVDNEHFARGAERIRKDADQERRLRGLPRNYFLCCARFVEKKNLIGLLQAYEQYRSDAGPDHWALVLVGDGPLRHQVEDAITALHLGADVSIVGFLQYNDLPAYYGLASAFVLPSTQEQWGLVVNEAMAAGLPVLVSRQCGAASLIKCGTTGWHFSPTVPGELALELRRAAASADTCRRMGLAAARDIAAWGPAAFAKGLRSAVTMCLPGRA